MSRPTVDQVSEQKVVNIQDSEFGKLVVWWREQDKNLEYHNGIYKYLVKAFI